MKALSLVGLIAVIFCSSAFASMDTKHVERGLERGLSFGRCPLSISVSTHGPIPNPGYMIAGGPVPPLPALLPNPGFKLPLNPTPSQAQTIIRAAAQLNGAEKEIIDQQLRVNEMLEQQLKEKKEKKNADKDSKKGNEDTLGMPDHTTVEVKSE